MTDPGQASAAAAIERPQMGGQRIMFRELQRRSLWYVGLRWWVPPAICVGVGIGWALRYSFAWLPILAVGGLIGLYNLGLALWSERIVRDRGRRPAADQEAAVTRFTYCQVILDYAAVFCLLYVTGGVTSPLVPFLLFHIIGASILLKPRAAYLFALLVALGLVALALGTDLGWWTPHEIIHGAGPRRTSLHPIPTLVFSTVAALATAYLTTSIMSVLRARVRALDQAHAAETELNEKLNALYEMVQVVVANKTLDEVLATTKQRLTTVMAVKAVAIKLLADDDRLMRYAAIQGLPEEFLRHQAIEVDKSPLNRRVLEGEPFVTGDLSEKQMFQFGEDLTAEGLRSVLFVPLRTEHGVIGILGAYCSEPDRFAGSDVAFFRLVADLVAIAIENARAFEAVERLLQDRSRFMLRVAHNLRTPLTAIASMNELLRGSYLGELSEQQREYLGRIDRRTTGMVELIDQLLQLAKSKSGGAHAKRVKVDMARLLARIQNTFTYTAKAKGIALEIKVEPDLPPVEGDPEMLQDLVENLIANAIRYTPEGRVDVKLKLRGGDKMAIEVRDTGIGIPTEALPDLFTEFFRAENAKAIAEVGTGLGLALVKQVAEQHQGSVSVDSREGQGSTFTVLLPTAAKEEGA